MTLREIFEAVERIDPDVLDLPVLVQAGSERGEVRSYAHASALVGHEGPALLLLTAEPIPNEVQ